MLTIFASLYSETKSFAITWGHRVRFLNESSGMANRPCHGYRRNAEGLLKIVPQEAEIVRQPFRWHQEGHSLRHITKALCGIGIKSPRGHTNRGIETVCKNLNNEKYYGYVMLQNHIFQITSRGNNPLTTANWSAIY